MLPEDSNILLSYVNMKLRDEYASLDDLCDSLGEDREVLAGKLAAAGWRYDGTLNQFVRGRVCP